MKHPKLQSYKCSCSVEGVSLFLAANRALFEVGFISR